MLNREDELILDIEKKVLCVRAGWQLGSHVTVFTGHGRDDPYRNATLCCNWFIRGWGFFPDDDSRITGWGWHSGGHKPPDKPQTRAPYGGGHKQALVWVHGQKGGC